MAIEENRIIHSLWIGKKLSPLELLTISSFIGNGHHFRLWVYEQPETELPAGVEICDATAIIPASAVFSYKDKNKYGHGKDSVAGFSDIFRYKLLYEKGGWWVDMDVTCLKALDFPDPYFFRAHNRYAAVGNVMKCPPRSDLMIRCYEDAISAIDRNNTDWDKPIVILNKHIAALSLTRYISDAWSNHDSWQETSSYLFTKRLPPVSWYFIHWQNEEWRYRRISRTSFYDKSFFAKSLSKYRAWCPPSVQSGRREGLWILFRYIAKNPYAFFLTKLNL